MLHLILITAALSADFSCKKLLFPNTCEVYPQCGWSGQECKIRPEACSYLIQDSCLNSVDCSWDTCTNECLPLELVKHECTVRDNFCQVKIQGKSMDKKMCLETEGCGWDKCYSNCNEKFMIPEKCKEPTTCKDLDVGTCMSENGCGWDECSHKCSKDTLITDECKKRLGVLPMMPGMPGRMPMQKYDPMTGRKYLPYHRRPLKLDRRVWTWIIALPFVCIFIFCLGYNFPSGLCDSSEKQSGGDYIIAEEGEYDVRRSASNYRPNHISLLPPQSDYTTSTLHTMQSANKPPSQKRYRGPSKSSMFQQTIGRASDSIDRERAFGQPKRMQMPHIPESDVDHHEYVPPARA